MSKLSIEELEKVVLPLASQIVDLNARCYALEAVVAWLGDKIGVDAVNVKTVLDHIYGQVLEKKLRKYEDLDPTWAARIDMRTELPTVDKNLLKYFRLDDDPQQPPSSP